MQYRLFRNLCISHNKYLLWVCFIVILSCKKEDLISEDNTTKAIFVYIAANNDLKYSALRSIDQMEKSYRNEYGDLIVFIKVDRNSSHILKIKHDIRDGIIASDTLKSYETQNSSDIDFMKLVFEDMRSFTSAKDYGLVLWSHATSWLPEPNGLLKTKSFGYDRGAEVELKNLRYALPKGLKFILFDACYMASVEVVYELRNNTDYIIASSSEVLSSSYPYDLILADLFSKDFLQVCRKFYDYYNNKVGFEQSATVSLIDCRYLDELAFETKQVLQTSINKDINNLTRVSQNFNFVLDIEVGFYDFWSLIKENYSFTQLTSLEATLTKCVLFKQHTKFFLNLPILESSGLTVSLIDNTNLLAYYKSLDWYKDSGIDNIYRTIK